VAQSRIFLKNGQMSTIVPDRDQFKSLLKLPKDRAVTMVNLLKFKEIADGGAETGAAAYGRYMQNVAPLIQKAGGRVVWMGEARSLYIGKTPDDDWDRVLIVEYPSPRAFVQMNTSAEYQAIHPDRDAGLARTVLLVTESQPLPD
tara:strand:- start:122 stop:556 length:435 start_codon:yes stop_codon:yes gene_type:complete